MMTRCMCFYVHASAGALGDQEGWIPLKLEFQIVESCLMWALGTELRSLWEAARALKHWPHTWTPERDAGMLPNVCPSSRHGHIE